MTTAPVELAPVRPAQWVRTTRLLLRDALSYLVSATLVMLVVLGALVVLARWRGWDLALRRTCARSARPSRPAGTA